MHRMSLYSQLLSQFSLGVGAFLMGATQASYAIITLPIGISLFIIGATFLIMEAGPNLCLMWIACGFGYTLVLSHDEGEQYKEEIEKWLSNNLRWKITYKQSNNLYHFMKKTDAIAFKIAWGADNYERRNDE